MSNEFSYKLLTYYYLPSKYEGGNLERRRFDVYLEFSHQVEENWALKTVVETFPNLKFYNRKKVNPLFFIFPNLTKSSPSTSSFYAGILKVISRTSYASSVLTS